MVLGSLYCVRFSCITGNVTMFIVIHFYLAKNGVKGIIIKSMKPFLICGGILILIPIVFLIMLYFGWVSY